jgi:site-specific DNA-methyltransferase (adenine-specific)
MAGTNTLYYGDNLDILRQYVADESVDLVYLDPPFNSNRDYNLIFKDESGNQTDAQLVAFEDTWHWGPSADAALTYLTNSNLNKGRVPGGVGVVIGALRASLGANQMMAYLVEMAVRLVELRRVLKPTGSLYLHCDTTAGAYLKVVLDATFGPANARNELIWHYGGRGAKAVARQFPRNHDVLLLYSKNAGQQVYNRQFVTRRFTRDEAKARGFRQVDDGRWFKTSPRGDYTDESVARLEAEGRIHRTKTGGVRVKYFLKESGGLVEEEMLVGDVWNDIPDAMHLGRELLGWETQKPLALLERVIATSSNPGDVVLDPFCGCGTALVAAQKLDRQWIGIDITYLSIAVMRSRLHDAFPTLGDIRVVGLPTEVEGARMLARQSLDGRYEFQYWALSMVDAQPLGAQRKKGADAGIDGRITFTDVGGAVQSVLVSVKSGGVKVGDIRDLVGTMKREGAPLGLFLTLEPPSKPMVVEAATAGTFHSLVSNRDYPAVQILTIGELLEGRRPELPLLLMPTYQQADKVEVESPGQERLFG